MKLNEYIKFERKKKKYTLMSLSNRANISYGMLYRLEDSSIKKPKPDLLQKISIALELDYKFLLKKAGYLDGVVPLKDSSEKKEFAVYDLESFVFGEKNEVFKDKFINLDNIDAFLSCKTNKFVPFFKKESVIGVKKVSSLNVSGRYIVVSNDNVELIIAKGKKSTVYSYVVYPNLYQAISIKNLKSDIYKIVEIQN